MPNFGFLNLMLASGIQHDSNLIVMLSELRWAFLLHTLKILEQIPIAGNVVGVCHSFVCGPFLGTFIYV